MKKLLQINSVILIMTLIFSIFISSAKVVKADGGLTYFFATFVVGQLVNNGRTMPNEKHEVNFTPTDNNYASDGIHIGSTYDSNEKITAICRGAYFDINPGISTRAKIKGVKLTCDEPEFPNIIAKYCNDILKIAKNTKELKTEIDLDSKDIEIVLDNNNKWLLRVYTKNLPQKLYNMKLTVYFTEEVSGGFFNSGKKTVVKWEETRIRKFIIDPIEIAKAVNNVTIQNVLKFCEGLFGGPPQLKPLEYVVNPNVEANAQMPLQANGTFAKAAVTIPKVETNYDSKTNQIISTSRTTSDSPPNNDQKPEEKPANTATPAPKVAEVSPIKEEIKPQEGEIYVFFVNAKNQPCDGHFFLKETDSKTSKINDYEIKLQDKTQYITDLSYNNQSQISTEPGVIYGTCPVGTMVQIRLFESENWSNCYAINAKYPIKITIRGGK